MKAFTILIFLILSCSPKSELEFRSIKDEPLLAKLNHASYLRKLSFSLRGHPPYPSEYAKLEKMPSSKQKDTYIDDKISEYLKSKSFVNKMEFRMEELFSLNASPTTKSDLYHFNDIPVFFKNPHTSFSIYNSTNYIFRKIFEQNLNWDNLLTSKNYRLYPIRDLTNKISDHEFFSITHPLAAGNKNQNNLLDIQFSENDYFVSGVLTTNRFMQRYSNTNLNRGRRRAAAIFKIFLCDEMSTVVVDESTNTSKILDLVYTNEPLRDQMNINLNSDRHGNDPSCKACHQKLDPLGKVFQNIGPLLSPNHSVGKLVYYQENGELFSKIVNGVSGLAQEIIKQKKYSKCQTKRFWEWFIGSDSELSEEKLLEVTEKFDELDRRPQDFIKYLLKRPEFYKLKKQQTDLQIKIQRVKKVLNRCTNCHQGINIPSFTKWPINGDEDKHYRWLLKIKSEMGLNNTSRSMPPPNSQWQPSNQDINDLNKWFLIGAPDESGKKYID